MSLEKKQVHHLSLDNFDLSKIKSVQKDFFHYEDIVIAKNITKKSSSNVLKEQEVYRTGEYRIIKLVKGRIKISLNLNTYTLQQGDIIFISRGMLVQVDNISEDVNGIGILFSEKSIVDDISEQNPVVILHPYEENKQYNNDLFDILWQTIQAKDFCNNTFLYLFKAYLSNVFFMIRQLSLQKQNVKLSRSEDIFKRFLVLTDRYGAKERKIKFYADKLFLSEKYLSAVIKKESGQTVMQWLNKQAVLEAKILLKHSDKTIYQVADELNFPNPAFFTKFFKRLTGITPKEYQKQD